jgi:hypothetical protein
MKTLLVDRVTTTKPHHHPRMRSGDFVTRAYVHLLITRGYGTRKLYCARKLIPPQKMLHGTVIVTSQLSARGRKTCLKIFFF